MRNISEFPKHYLFIALVLSVFIPLVICAPAFCDDKTAILNRHLERLSELAKVTTYVKSDFVQTKYITFMDEKLLSEGFFVYTAPQELVWEYTKPVASGLIYKNGKASLWYASEAGKDSGDSARQSAGGRSGAPENMIAKVIAEHLITWTNLDVETLKKNYTIKLMAESPLTLALTPKISIPNSPVLGFKVIFEENGMDAKELYLYEADDDYTKIDFFNTVRR